jgi:hypothetical protein
MTEAETYHHQAPRPLADHQDSPFFLFRVVHASLNFTVHSLSGNSIFGHAMYVVYKVLLELPRTFQVPRVNEGRPETKDRLRIALTC